MGVKNAVRVVMDDYCAQYCSNPLMEEIIHV